MEEDRGRSAIARPDAARNKQLRGYLHSIGSRHGDRLRLNELRRWKVGGHCLRRQRDRGATPPRHAHRVRRRTRGGREEGQGPVAQFRRRPLDSLASRNRDRRAATHSNSPQMATVDVALVRVEDDVATVAAQRHVFDFERPGGQQSGDAPGGRNGVEVIPPILLPWKHETVSCPPQELIFPNDGMQHTAVALVGRPDASGNTRRHVGHENRPGAPRALRLEQHQLRRRRLTNEGNALPVRRPDLPPIGIHARREKTHRPRLHVVDANERMIPAIADEAQHRSVGRPARISKFPAHVNEQFGLTPGRSKGQVPEFTPTDNRSIASG